MVREPRLQAPRDHAKLPPTIDWRQAGESGPYCAGIPVSAEKPPILAAWFMPHAPPRGRGEVRYIELFHRDTLVFIDV